MTRRVTSRARRALSLLRSDPSASVAGFLRDYFRSPASKYVVQVGANDGLQSDPLRPFLKQPGNYRAVLLEPLPYYANALRELYAGRTDIIVRECAAGPEEGRAELYFIDPAMADRMNGDGPRNDWAHGQGSLDRSSVEYWIRANAFRGATYRRSIPEYIASIRVATVPIVPLSTVMDSHATNALLCIDMQGRELDVLLGVDWMNPPRYVVYEDDLGKGEEVARFLVGKGYRYVCGKNDKVYEFHDSSTRGCSTSVLP